jgi:hypothetical protein
LRDTVWLSGTTWACVAGWGQLFSMFHAASAETGYVGRRWRHIARVWQGDTRVQTRRQGQISSYVVGRQLWLAPRQLHMCVGLWQLHCKQRRLVHARVPMAVALQAKAPGRQRLRCRHSCAAGVLGLRGDPRCSSQRAEEGAASHGTMMAAYSAPRKGQGCRPRTRRVHLACICWLVWWLVWCVPVHAMQ